jgi:hypothetical protein
MLLAAMTGALPRRLLCFFANQVSMPFTAFSYAKLRGNEKILNLFLAI